MSVRLCSSRRQQVGKEGYPHFTAGTTSYSTHVFCSGTPKILSHGQAWDRNFYWKQLPVLLTNSNIWVYKFAAAPCQTGSAKRAKVTAASLVPSLDQLVPNAHITPCDTGHRVKGSLVH